MPVILTENAANQVKKFQTEHQFPAMHSCESGWWQAVAVALATRWPLMTSSMTRRTPSTNSMEFRSWSTRRVPCIWTVQPWIGTSESIVKASALKIPKLVNHAVAAARSQSKDRANRTGNALVVGAEQSQYLVTPASDEILCHAALRSGRQTWTTLPQC